jgi:hypothetical protein
MQEKTIKLFVSVLKEQGLDVRTDYSGRGMMGKRCLGITVDSIGELLCAIAEISNIMGRDRMDEEFGELFTILNEDTRSDNMGYSTIYYFPSVQIEEDEE